MLTVTERVRLFCSTCSPNTGITGRQGQSPSPPVYGQYFNGSTGGNSGVFCRNTRIPPVRLRRCTQAPRPGARASTPAFGLSTHTHTYTHPPSDRAWGHPHFTYPPSDGGWGKTSSGRKSIKWEVADFERVGYVGRMNSTVRRRSLLVSPAFQVQRLQ